MVSEVAANDAFVSEYLFNIRLVLLNIRDSFEIAISKTGLSESEAVELRDLYLNFEAARLDFVDAIGRKNLPVDFALATLRDNLERLTQKKQFPLFARYRVMGKIRSRSGARRSTLDPLLHKEGYSLAEGIEFLIGSIHDTWGRLSGYVVKPEPIQPSFDARTIRKIVPSDQVLAPLKFDIVDQKITISPQSPQLLEEDRQSASSAKESLLANGSQILGEIEKSNCDPRLLENVKDLQQKLEIETDIIKLGLANIGTGIMCVAFAAELPEAVRSMIEAHNVGISMYVGQFIEWRTFSEKAALAEISNEDAATISDAAEKLIGELEKNPLMADPEVPRSLRALNSLLDDPKGISKRAAYAVLRSIENLLIKVFNYGADMLEKTVEKTVEKGSTAASRVIVISMITAALAGAAALAPIASHIPHSGWISKAVEVVQKQLDKLD